MEFVFRVVNNSKNNKNWGLPMIANVSFQAKKISKVCFIIEAIDILNYDKFKDVGEVLVGGQFVQHVGLRIREAWGVLTANIPNGSNRIIRCNYLKEEDDFLTGNGCIIITVNSSDPKDLDKVKKWINGFIIGD